MSKKRNPTPAYVASGLQARASWIYSDFGSGSKRWIVSLSAPYKHDKRLRWGVEGQGATGDEALHRMEAAALNHGYRLPPSAILLVRRAIVHAITSDTGRGEVEASSRRAKNPRACAPGSCPKISLSRRAPDGRQLPSISGHYTPGTRDPKSFNWYAVTKSFPTVKAAVADAKAKMPQYEWRGGFVKENPKKGASKRNPSSSLMRVNAATLAERAGRAGWHDTTPAGRTKVLAYINEMRRRLGLSPASFTEYVQTPGLLANTLTAFLAQRVNNGAKSNPRGRDFYLTTSGKALPASDLAFIKKCAQAMRPNRPLKDTGWEAIAARPADAAILLTYKPNVEHAIFAYAAEKGGAHARYGKVPEGYRSKPTKVNPRGGGVNARGGWRHEKGSDVWLARYANGPSYQIVRHEDGNYWLEAGRWSKAADSFKSGVNSGVYRTLSEAQHEAGNMRRRWALGRNR